MGGWVGDGGQCTLGDWCPRPVRCLPAACVVPSTSPQPSPLPPLPRHGRALEVLGAMVADDPSRLRWLLGVGVLQLLERLCLERDDRVRGEWFREQEREWRRPAEGGGGGGGAALDEE